ncbi:MAG: PLP-dependent transferase [Rhodococcus sp. (in: high G+C Gram-positive bacteria)]|uniref:PLP-dependent transferase n=1 Tax=Rhodococcus sp. TaxID=1831 RepID=UPI002AD84D44|nr:PLP-dependent transferase [Rhodococcus sp. (in: high G+C Gram-positive bacteria)]
MAPWHPQSAFTLIQGVETLPQRMDAHVANARAVAEWLGQDPRIDYVRWAGLESHPHHDRASKYLPAGPGAVFAFGIDGGREAGQTFVESARIASHVANIGDVRTLVIHPASTTHRQLTDDQLRDAGVGPELIQSVSDSKTSRTCCGISIRP